MKRTMKYTLLVAMALLPTTLLLSCQERNIDDDLSPTLKEGEYATVYIGIGRSQTTRAQLPKDTDVLDGFTGASPSINQHGPEDRVVKLRFFSDHGVGENKLPVEEWVSNPNAEPGDRGNYIDITDDVLEQTKRDKKYIWKIPQQNASVPKKLRIIANEKSRSDNISWGDPAIKFETLSTSDQDYKLRTDEIHKKVNGEFALTMTYESLNNLSLVKNNNGTGYVLAENSEDSKFNAIFLQKPMARLQVIIGQTEDPSFNSQIVLQDMKVVNLPETFPPFPLSQVQKDFTTTAEALYYNNTEEAPTPADFDISNKFARLLPTSLTGNDHTYQFFERDNTNNVKYEDDTTDKLKVTRYDFYLPPNAKKGITGRQNAYLRVKYKVAYDRAGLGLTNFETYVKYIPIGSPVLEKDENNYPTGELERQLLFPTSSNDENSNFYQFVKNEDEYLMEINPDTIYTLKIVFHNDTKLYYDIYPEEWSTQVSEGKVTYDSKIVKDTRKEVSGSV